jgi:hypothetical protein
LEHPKNRGAGTISPVNLLPLLAFLGEQDLRTKGQFLRSLEN